MQYNKSGKIRFALCIYKNISSLGKYFPKDKMKAIFIFME